MNDTASLVREAKAGSREAFEELIRLHARLVWSHLWGLARDPAWVEDLSQETFMKAWVALDSLKDDASFKPWLMSIARRTCWDHEEKRSRWKTAAVEPPEEREEAPVEKIEQVREALGALPERYRLPLTLHYVEGLKYDAISSQLGLTNGTLRGLLSRGLKQLRAALVGRMEG